MMKKHEWLLGGQKYLRFSLSVLVGPAPSRCFCEAPAARASARPLANAKRPFGGCFSSSFCLFSGGDFGAFFGSFFFCERETPSLGPDLVTNVNIYPVCDFCSDLPPFDRIVSEAPCGYVGLRPFRCFCENFRFSNARRKHQSGCSETCPNWPKVPPNTWEMARKGTYFGPIWNLAPP